LDSTGIDKPDREVIPMEQEIAELEMMLMDVEIGPIVIHTS
jgi:hypothetical protein